MNILFFYRIPSLPTVYLRRRVHLAAHSRNGGAHQLIGEQ